jgi:hypothetical protein
MLIDAVILMPEAPDTAYGRNQCGLAIALLTSESPRKVIPEPETFTLLQVQCVLQRDGGSTLSPLGQLTKQRRLHTEN